MRSRQREEVCDFALQSSGGGRRIRSTHLTDLLSAAAALVAEIELEEPEEDAAVGRAQQTIFQLSPGHQGNQPLARTVAR
ncbi:unnamed protein product [Lampetra fluviatilis]